ncbi:MAG: hypothetical protein Q9172_006676 [Xanthocarpia lactea]
MDSVEPPVCFSGAAYSPPSISKDIKLRIDLTVLIAAQDSWDISAAMAIPWEQTADFLRTSDRTIRPGGPTSYNPPRRIGQGPGDNTQDVTDFHPGQWNWSPANMPDVSFSNSGGSTLAKSKHRSYTCTSRQESEANSTPVVVPKRRDQSMMPKAISCSKDGLPLEQNLDLSWITHIYRTALERTNGGGSLKHGDYGPNRTRSHNTLQRLVSRNRPDAMMVTWPQQHKWLMDANAKKAAQKPAVPSPEDKTRDKPLYKSKTKSKVKNSLLMTDAEIEANSTRGHTPGLIDPRLGEVPGNRVPWLKQHPNAGKSMPRSTGGRRSGNNDSQDTGPSRSSTGQSLTNDISAASEASDQTDSEDDTVEVEDQSPNLCEDNEAVQALLLEQIGIVQGCRGTVPEAVDTATEEDGDNNNSKPRKRRRVGSAASQDAQSGHHLAVPTSLSLQGTSRLPPRRNAQARGIVMPPPTPAAPVAPRPRATRALLPRPSPLTPRTERQPISDDDLYDPHTIFEPRGPVLDPTTYLVFPRSSQNTPFRTRRQPTSQNTVLASNTPEAFTFKPPRQSVPPSVTPYPQPRSIVFTPTTCSAPIHADPRNYYTPPTFAPPEAIIQQAQNTNNISNLASNTPPPDLIPAGWSDYFNSYQFQALGEQHQSHPAILATNEHRLAPGNINSSGTYSDLTRGPNYDDAVGWSAEDQEEAASQRRRKP